MIFSSPANQIFDLCKRVGDIQNWLQPLRLQTALAMWNNFESNPVLEAYMDHLKFVTFIKDETGQDGQQSTSTVTTKTQTDTKGPAPLASDVKMREPSSQQGSSSTSSALQPGNKGLLGNESTTTSSSTEKSTSQQHLQSAQGTSTSIQVGRGIETSGGNVGGSGSVVGGQGGSKEGGVGNAPDEPPNKVPRIGDPSSPEQPAAGSPNAPLIKVLARKLTVKQLQKLLKLYTKLYKKRGECKEQTRDMNALPAMQMVEMVESPNLAATLHSNATAPTLKGELKKKAVMAFHLHRFQIEVSSATRRANCVPFISSLSLQLPGVTFKGVQLNVHGCALPETPGPMKQIDLNMSGVAAFKDDVIYGLPYQSRYFMYSSLRDNNISALFSFNPRLFVAGVTILDRFTNWSILVYHERTKRWGVGLLLKLIIPPLFL